MSGTARILVACGNKYGFQSVYLPMLAQLRGLGRIRCFVLDYPRDYGIGPIERGLRGLEYVEELVMIPDNIQAWRHHRALSRISQHIRSGPAVDLLVTDGDVMAISRYLIEAVRARGGRVVALQKEAPKHLLIRYAAQQRRRSGQAADAPGGSSRGLASRLAGRSPLSLVRAVMARLLNKARRWWRVRMHAYVLPLLCTGRVLGLDRKRRGLDFAPRLVDLSIVYSPLVKEAVQFFSPGIPVVMADHPLAGSCRCSAAVRPLKLLVVLTGPWRNYVNLDNPPEAMLERWSGLIEQAVRLRGFSSVDLRPHPREAEPYPQRLAARLERAGLQVRITDPQGAPVSQLACDYAAVLGPPSGALTEAAASCRSVSVLCVEGMQGFRAEAPVEGFSSNIVRVARDEPLEARHFQRSSGPAVSAGTIRAILERVLRGELSEERGYPATDVGVEADGAGIGVVREPVDTTGLR